MKGKNEVRKTIKLKTKINKSKARMRKVLQKKNKARKK